MKSVHHDLESTHAQLSLLLFALNLLIRPCVLLGCLVACFLISSMKQLSIKCNDVFYSVFFTEESPNARRKRNYQQSEADRQAP
jgi:hypothetical protein